MSREGHSAKRAGEGRASFVVRVWREGEPHADRLTQSDPSEPSVRGSIQVIGRESVRYFASLEDMTDIIAEAVEVSPAEPRSGS